MEQTIKEMILDMIVMWSYDKGHAYGQEEVQARIDSYLHDMQPVFARLDELELK